MAYQWQREDGDGWVPVRAVDMPKQVRSKKSVLFAHAGKVMEVPTADGGVERFRLVRAPRVEDPAAE